MAMAVVLREILNNFAMLEDISLGVCVAISCAVLVFYCVTGGIIAGVYTDVVQGAVMMVAGVLVLFAAIKAVDGGISGAVSHEKVLRRLCTKRIIKSHGYEHETFPSMKHGGPGAERHEKTLWVGWVFGMLCILFYMGCLTYGMTRGGTLGPAKLPLILGTGIFLAIFTGLIFSYKGYMNEDTHELFLSFPKPTVWMLLGIWTFPVLFMFLYYYLFDHWFFTEEDEKRLEESTAARQQTHAEDF